MSGEVYCELHPREVCQFYDFAKKRMLCPDCLSDYEGTCVTFTKGKNTIRSDLLDEKEIEEEIKSITNEKKEQIGKLLTEVPSKEEIQKNFKALQEIKKNLKTNLLKMSDTRKLQE